MTQLSAIIIVHTPSKGISLYVKLHNAENLYSTFKMCTFNCSIMYLRYEYFQGILQWLFRLFYAESTNVWEMGN